MSTHLHITAAAYAAHARKQKCDSVLGQAAEIAVQALIKLGCKGTEWLHLTEGE